MFVGEIKEEAFGHKMCLYYKHISISQLKVVFLTRNRELRVTNRENYLTHNSLLKIGIMHIVNRKIWSFEHFESGPNDKID